jgi:hypothetical protein
MPTLANSSPKHVFHCSVCPITTSRFQAANLLTFSLRPPPPMMLLLMGRPRSDADISEQRLKNAQPRQFSVNLLPSLVAEKVTGLNLPMTDESNRNKYQLVPSFDPSLDSAPSVLACYPVRGNVVCQQLQLNTGTTKYSSCEPSNDRRK